jgi:hypothetical protein
MGEAARTNETDADESGDRQRSRRERAKQDGLDALARGKEAGKPKSTLLTAANAPAKNTAAILFLEGLAKYLAQRKATSQGPNVRSGCWQYMLKE